MCKVSPTYVETAFSGRLCKFANKVFSNKVFIFKRPGICTNESRMLAAVS